MPVRSPEVFASALKGLFDRRSSSLELLEEPRLVGNDIVAEWRLAGRLGLPWKPSIKPFIGRTTFTLDGNGLVIRHVEEWSLPAWDAFLAALVPSLHLGAAPAPSISELWNRALKARRRSIEAGCAGAGACSMARVT